MRPAKRSKLALCATCGKPADEKCAICQIITKRQVDVAKRWNICRLGKFSEHWLDAAIDVIQDGGFQDVLAVVGSKISDIDIEQVDVCANLVCCISRMDHLQSEGEKLYNLCFGRFQKSKSNYCVLASTHHFPLKNAQREALRTAKNAIALGRKKAADVICCMYGINAVSYFEYIS